MFRTAISGRLFIGALLLTLTTNSAVAHHCMEITEIQLEVGETFKYRIRADVVEEEPSQYGISTEPDANIAEVLTETPFFRKNFGDYIIQAVNPGTTSVTFGWVYEPNNAAGLCSLSITVVPKKKETPETSGEGENSGYSNDPVNLFLGEYIHTALPDIDLGGPLPLRFERYYASDLLKSGFASNTLGINWQSNFDLRLTVGTSSATATLYRGVKVAFTKSGATSWTRATPANSNYQLIEDSGIWTLWDPIEKKFYDFNSFGVLTKIHDRNGNALTLEYDTDAVIPNKVSDNYGRELYFFYEGLHHLSSVTDGRTTIYYNVNFASQLIGVTHPKDFSASPTLLTTTYNYASSFGDGAQQLTDIILPAGNNQIALTYTDGRVTTETDGEGNSWQYTYTLDGDELVTTVLGPDGLTSTYRHNDIGELIDVQHPSNPTKTITYDPKGNRDDVLFDGQSIGGTEYNAVGRPTKQVSAVGEVATASYLTQTNNGFTFYLLDRINYPDGTVGDLDYDANGNLLKITQRNGGVFNFTYNGNGQLIQRTLPNGNVIDFTYDGLGRLETFTDSSGRTTSYAYTYPDRDLVESTTVDGAVTTTQEFVYNPAGSIISYTDSTGETTVIDLGDNGNADSVQTDGKTEVFAYDDNDRVVAVSGPGLRVFERTFDSLGRVTSEGVTSLPTAALTTYAYDPTTGLLQTLTDAEGRTWTFTYDASGNLTAITDPANETLLTNYDAMGRTTQTTTPEGRIRTFDYDFSGQLIATTDGLGRTRHMGYTTNGILSNIENAAGLTLDIKRDELGFIGQISLPSGLTWHFGYDNFGNRTSTVSPLNGTATFANLRGDMVGATFPSAMGMEIINYGSNGLISSRDYSDGTNFTYTYDINGNLSTANGIALDYNSGFIWESNGVLISHDEHTGFIDSITPKTGVIVTFTNDLTNRVTRINDTTGAGDIELGYDAVGRLTSIMRPNGANTNFQYDRDGLLVVWEHTPDLASAELTYDAANQLVEAERHGPLEYDPSSAIETFPQAFFGTADAQVDPLGRVTQTGDLTLEWNLATQLTAIEQTDQPDLTLTHNAFGLLTSISDGVNMREFVWNFGFEHPVVSLEKVNGVDKYAYVHIAPGRLVYRIDLLANERQYYHFDEAGNTLFLSSETGSIIGRCAYSPFGLRQEGAPLTDNVFTYSGRSGAITINDRLYQMGVRVYDSTSARFLSPDPIFPYFDPVGVNPYNYALCNPLQYTDYTGQWPEFVDKVIGQISNAGAVNGTLDAIGHVLRPILEKSFEVAKGKINPQIVDTTVDGVRALRRVDQLETVMDFTSGVAPNKLGKLGAGVNTAGVFAQLYGLYNDGQAAKAAADETLSEYQKLLNAANQQYEIDIRIIDELYRLKKISSGVREARYRNAQRNFEETLERLKSGYYIDLGIDMLRFTANGFGGFVPFYGEVRDYTGFLP